MVTRHEAGIVHVDDGDGAPVLATATRTVSEYSASAKTIFASPWSSMKAMESASRRVLSALSTAPMAGTPKCSSIIGGVFGSIAATVSPLRIPKAASALARRRQRVETWAQVRRSPPCTTARRSGYTAAARSRKLNGVSGAWFAGVFGRPNS